MDSRVRENDINTETVILANAGIHFESITRLITESSSVKDFR